MRFLISFRTAWFRRTLAMMLALALLVLSLSPALADGGAGGGVEVGISKRWSWKAEYLYYDWRNESFIANPVPANPPFQVAYGLETRAYTFNAGLNFRF